MAMKNFKIERNFCDCHPETCCCDTHKLTYEGETLARNNKKTLEKLIAAIKKEIKNGQKSALQHERRRTMKSLSKIDWPRDPFDY